MREVKAADISEAVAKMCVSANRLLPEDVRKKFEECHAEETGAAQEIFRQLLENADLARNTGLPLCQDTGLAVFFVEMGEDVRVTGSSLSEAINEGMRKGYQDGYLRKSDRKSTRLNSSH